MRDFMKSQNKENSIRVSEEIRLLEKKKQCLWTLASTVGCTSIDLETNELIVTVSHTIYSNIIKR